MSKRAAIRDVMDDDSVPLSERARKTTPQSCPDLASPVSQLTTCLKSKHDFERPPIEKLIPPSHRKEIDEDGSVQLSAAAINSQRLRTADGTNYTYNSQCVAFLKWVAERFPESYLSDKLLANYLTWWLENGKKGKKPHSASSVGTMSSAIVGGLRSMYMDSPYKGFFRSLTGPETHDVRTAYKMRGRRELAAHERVYQVQGLIPQKVLLMCNYALDCGTPRDVRDAAMFALNALTWFRGDTMYRVRMDNLEEFDGTLFILPDVLKNSQTGSRIKGIPLVRNLLYPCMCPVKTMAAWLSIRGFGPGPLFCMTDKTGTKLLHLSPMNRAQYVDRICNALLQTGIATTIGYREWGTHSFRRGGATWAAYNGITLHEIQEWGTWRSISAAVRYVDKVGFLKSPVAKLYETSSAKQFASETQYRRFVNESDIVHKLEKSYETWEQEEVEDNHIDEPDVRNDSEDQDDRDDDDDDSE
ncbi:MAG: tyrosine-type recombinase/integrase, partial [Polynucleobacter sp.]|nr:tyrosine-type recombinase/integrase [Polynucleobacter sp.]